MNVVTGAGLPLAPNPDFERQAFVMDRVVKEMESFFLHFPEARAFMAYGQPPGNFIFPYNLVWSAWVRGRDVEQMDAANLAVEVRLQGFNFAKMVAEQCGDRIMKARYNFILAEKDPEFYREMAQANAPQQPPNTSETPT